MGTRSQLLLIIGFLLFSRIVLASSGQDNNGDKIKFCSALSGAFYAAMTMRDDHRSPQETLPFVIPFVGVYGKHDITEEEAKKIVNDVFFDEQLINVYPDFMREVVLYGCLNHARMNSYKKLK